MKLGLSPGNTLNSNLQCLGFLGAGLGAKACRGTEVEVCPLQRLEHVHLRTLEVEACPPQNNGGFSTFTSELWTFEYDVRTLKV